MKITSVEPQTLQLRSGYKRFNIFLDGQFAFGADEDLVVEKRLVPGKLLTPSEVKQLLVEAEVGKLMEKMYRWFEIRQRSEKEVKDYFRIKNLELRIKGKETVSDLSVESVIATLKRKGILNDLQFAKAWIDARSKKKGIRVIKQELFQKGISKEIIEEISNKMQDTNWEEVASKLLEKKLRVWRNLEPLKLKKKAFDFLMRRGFEYDVVSDAIEKILEKDYN